ncbi:AAA family ATPase [Actinoplanes xinjiangensis]|nr:AAA family ATPase [Actinoplanes xinjiangensis]
MAARLAERRRSAFVGRDRESAVFRAALRQERGAPSTLFVHGMGGIGKSTLVRRFADEAEAAGRTVVLVDGRYIDPSPDGFRTQTKEAFDDDHAVLLIDAFEHCQGLEHWLRDHFLPTLPERTVIVLAGRCPPSRDWTTDVAWTGSLAVMSLEPLDEQAALDLLSRRGADDSTSREILAFTGGHPLALSLAGVLAAAGPPGRTPWTPGPDVLTALLNHLVGDLPSDRHRLALETAAHNYTTTEDLLGAVVGRQHAAALFAWLRDLPFAEPGRNGLTVHELVSEVLDRDLRWRDPQGYEQMHNAGVRHLIDRARNADPHNVLSATRALCHLKWHGPAKRYFPTTRQDGDVYESPLQPEDHAFVVQHLEEAESPAEARVARHWLTHRPADFWIYRSTHDDAPVGFLLWLRLTDAGQHATADPVTAACWKWSERSGPVAHGQQIMILRFAVSRGPSGRARSMNGSVPGADLAMQQRVIRSWLREQAVACSFVATADARVWTPLMRMDGHLPFAEVTLPPGRPFTLYGHDWRRQGLDVWLQQALALHEADPAGTATAVNSSSLDRDAFDQAVREALRHLHDPIALSASPLLQLCGAPDAAGADRIEALRQMLTSAVAEMLDEPRHARQHRSLAVTYLEQPRTQEAAAHRLGLPLGTYRRHLARGVQRLSDHLWQRQQLRS